MKNTVRQNIVTAIITFAASYCLFAFTPLRATLPWNPGAHARRDAIRNAIMIDSLENIITRWELYTDNLRRSLAGEEGFSADSLLIKSGKEYLTGIDAAEAARKDSLLKEAVRTDE